MTEAEAIKAFLATAARRSNEGTGFPSMRYANGYREGWRAAALTMRNHLRDDGHQNHSNGRTPMPSRVELAHDRLKVAIINAVTDALPTSGVCARSLANAIDDLITEKIRARESSGIDPNHSGARAL